MKIVRLALVAMLFAAGGFLLSLSATAIPLVSELKVVRGTIAALRTDEIGAGIAGYNGLEIVLHQHDEVFRYYTAQPGDYADLNEQLAVGDQLIVWVQLPSLVHWHGVWYVQRENEVLRSFSQVRAAQHAPMLFFFGGLFLLCTGLLLWSASYRQRMRTDMPGYRLARANARIGLRSLL